MTLPLKPPQQTAAVDSSYSDKHKSHGKNKNHGKNGSRGKHWKHGKNGHHGIDKYGAPDRTTWNEDNIFTDYTQYIPDTGVTRYYDLTVDEANLAPDGVDAPFMQVFNGQFPGPLIEADWGDHIEVRVHNHLRNNGTSIHWHGFIHTNNTQNDGVNGVTQCPIPPLSSLTYRFRAQRYGTSWYHSHTSVQYGNGLYGPILIRGPSSANWDVDLGTVNIGDWYHKSQFELVQDFFVSGPPTASATVFNGQGVFNDNGTLRGSYYDITKELKFRPGRKHLLRLINSASDAKYEISLDEHTMTVVSLDWIPVRPFKTKTLFLSIGQRAEVIIKATEDPRKSYWFRADTTALGMNRGTTCGDKNLSANQSKAIISYVGADGSDPDSTPWTYTPHCSDVAMNNAKPVVALTLPPPIFRQNHSLDPIKPNATGDIVFNVDNSSLYLNWNKPTLNLINDGFTQFPRQYNVYQLNGTDRDSVIVVLQDNTGIPHPIHLHGHDMSIAALGNGTWNGTINFDNPPRRDTVQVEGGGHLVMHFALDNPGTWLWHCHIAFHVSAGLGAQFVERIQDINTVENVTQTYQTCSQWQAWTDFNLVLQTDSGV
ncbi:multicopper oxidase-domain-containing protein [Protomyces lactucae-debilis]|uniref:Multicopper oxidase-domain-containing protein n=1 Tax=Protomyces lactucae-debilis TaxID=2754530 RepID=A0A1Y2FGZ1_PROLT|nr:multicopper oxidase-domain-containing protein [Protomyces lactucae-debilis]ORY83202.1 multicopper oxidase-domain-containing protein [Protomyces lactucae-debilis]